MQLLDIVEYFEMRELTLRELEALAGLRLAVLLTLNRTAVAGHEAALLQNAAQVGFEVGECAGNTVAERTGLAGKAAAGNRAHDIELALAASGFQRLLDDHAKGGAREEHFEGAIIHDDLARAALDPHTRHRVLAAAGGIGAALCVELGLGGFDGSRGNLAHGSAQTGE